MKLQITLTDEDFEIFQAEAKALKKSPELYISQRLLEFKNIPSNERYLLIRSDDREKLECILDTQLNSPDQLVKKVASLNAVSFGMITFHLAEPEIRELQSMATRYKTSPEIEMQKRLDMIRPLIFNCADIKKY